MPSARPACDGFARSLVRHRKVIGTDAYGHYLGCVFIQDGDRIFWDARDSSKAIVIDLEGDSFSRLSFEVKDPAATVAFTPMARA